MAHHTQITLADEQYERLGEESRRSGLGLAELVRRAKTGCTVRVARRIRFAR
jgi:hypothetical protein